MEALSTVVPRIYGDWSPGDRYNTSRLGSVVIGLVLCTLSKYCFWLFLASRWLWICSMLTGVDDLPGCWIVLLWRISLGKGILRLIGVDCRSSRRSSIDLPPSWVVLRVVFRVLTCLSMNPSDWGKCGEEVV